MSDHFKQFITYCNKQSKIIERQDPRDQKQLMEDLFLLEEEFKQVIVSKKWDSAIYPAFVQFIMQEKKNILAARVYFRERQSTFTKDMSQIFRDPSRYIDIGNFRINYEFVNWTCKNFVGVKYKALHNLKGEIIKVRHTLAMKDVFLALNRARLFWSKAPNCKLDYMDIIQDACEGYMHAVDKFTPPYTVTFRAVVIGRMLLRMLLDHNSTMVRLPPTDQRILYRINNAKYREGLTESDEILKFVQESFPGVTLERMAAIELATEVFYPFNNSVESSKSDWTDTSETSNQELCILESDLKSKLSQVFEQLPLIDQKILKLKFGDKKWN